MSYSSTIKTFSPLTLDDILKTAKANVPAQYQSRPWTYPGLDHGTARLENEDQLCCYLSAYGDMHKGKLDYIMRSFPYHNIDSPLEIIDWGCGQGIATVRFVEQLRKRGLFEKLQKVTLVEPSKCALDRARLNVELSIGEDIIIELQNYYLPASVQPTDGEVIGGIHVCEPICVHLFSNILDISTIDLKELAFMVSSSGYRHYFLCVGPVNFGNDRIPSFGKYFQLDYKDIFVSPVKIPQYGQLANGKWYGCAAMGFQIMRQEGKPFLVPLSYYPPKQFFGAYRLDAIEQADQNMTNSKDYWRIQSAFEVLAPFDIGASIYEDIDPILAVLNNIITRGLPTKCSPYIEEQLNSEFQYAVQTEKYGTIRYNAISDQDVELNKELLRQIPIGIARIQKVIIEAVLTGHISLDTKVWKVLVKECDVPCAALAFEDLKQMYNHLTSMSRDYNSRVFPDVELHVVSSEYSSSPLQLNARTYRNSKQVNKELAYDMVLDISLSESIDAANVQFSEFKAKNNCYFNVRSSLYVYSNREIYTTDRIVYKPITFIGDGGNHEVIEDQQEHLEYFLQMVFRKKGFRPGQLPILNRALQIKGVIGLLPTGGGKSLTYQLAAMLQPGITVIIDPLKSLMQDQYDGLISAGIDCCTYINSELGPEERALNESRMENSQVIFTFMSPERLCIYEFRERLQNMKDLNVYFSYGVIDEVHCVSEWGQDFRFSYLHLGRNLYSYVNAKNGSISLFGLTATASFDVLSDVERELSGNGAFTLDPDTIVRYENSNRLELQYKIEKIEVQYQADSYYNPGPFANLPYPVNIGDSWSTHNQKSQFLSTYLDKIPAYVRELQTEDSLKTIVERFQERETLEGIDPEKLLVDMPDSYLDRKDNYEQAGIVFCPHVNTSGISVSVNSATLSQCCEVGTFSGSAIEGAVQGNESMEFMKKFRENKLPVMVATKAFGMGIDKPNVRFTINMNYSSSLESFVQEAGRAGRDRKMALSVILMSDYNLVRINKSCPSYIMPYRNIVSKWFKEEDLKQILESVKMTVPDQYLDHCNPLSDIVRLKCTNTQEDPTTGKRLVWNCKPEDCSLFANCQVRHLSNSKGWMFHTDLREAIRNAGVRIPKENIEYQGADYNTVMYFFDNNFKGEYEERKKMNYLLSEIELEYFLGNDKKDKPSEYRHAKGFLDVVLNSKPGTEVVSLISYADDSYADIAKAIYRMCIIGLIDDFTQDYSMSRFRILSTRKKNGMYYERLKDFLMRYYAEDRAENEVEKASVRKGQNEIHKTLGYLTEFIYDKVAMKRKRAIDDMRRFCLIGIEPGKDWKALNEDLKDEIYYYFNSKYAREGYKTDNGEDFSLLDDTNRGKTSSFDIVYKYLRVIDNDVMGTSGSPKDNIKHLRGAVRLIRRSETDVNAALCLLNVYCLLVLKAGSNRNMMDELQSSYIEGYSAFKKEVKNTKLFLKGIEEFKRQLNANGRNVATAEDFKMFEDLDLIAEYSFHRDWVNDFTTKYNN